MKTQLHVNPHRQELAVTVSNLFNGAFVSGAGYGHDLLGRRTGRIDTVPGSSVTNSFGYNARSEVTNAVQGADNYAYCYDSIGNRVWSAENTLTNTYTANRLNQYTAVTPSVAVAYDADGNMTRLGDWRHTWDAENRLTGSQPAGFATNGAIRLEYVYNHKNLRVAKIKKQLSGRGADYPFNPLQPGTWDAIETRRYVWDGYNIAAEIVIDEVTPSTNVTYYTWGLDLSGTLQGAGGVGGLLAVIRSDGTFFPCYDANGNITDCVDAAGNIRAHYEYSPFGEITAQSGDLADTFTHRFSTKPFDAETSLVMYQLRPYAPKLGCWFNRDPIEEDGGLNLSVFVNNNPANKWDYLGKASVPWQELVFMQHFSQLKNQLKSELKDLCPLSTTEWKRDGVIKNCCRPKNCAKEADKLAETYVNALSQAARARKPPGGNLGNLCVHVLSISRETPGEVYPRDLDVGLTCGGWTDMAEKVLSPIVDDSECWVGEAEMSKLVLKVFSYTFTSHMWFSLRVMEGPKVHLDPWKSGGLQY